MIIINEGIMVEGDAGPKSVKILWDLLNVIGSRFVILALHPDDSEESIKYSDKFRIVEKNKSSVALFNCSKEEDFVILLELLSDWCVTDFYITINSFFDNVLKSVESGELFSDKSFLVNKYLDEFPRTVHVEEDRFFIDFKLFKEYAYQLERAAKRLMK